MKKPVIVFDFGNVVAFFNRRRAAEQLAAYGPPEISIDKLTHFIFFTDLEPAFESGRLSEQQYLDTLRREFHLRGTDEQLAEACADMFTPNPEVCEFIPKLKGHYRLGLLSNTNELHYRHFRRQFADILGCFDRLFVSHEMGLRKPNPDIYRLVSEYFAASPRDCLFIDDLSENVAAAIHCGWHGIVYRPGEDLEIKVPRTFSALPPPGVTDAI